MVEDKPKLPWKVRQQFAILLGFQLGSLIGYAIAMTGLWDHNWVNIITGFIAYVLLENAARQLDKKLQIYKNKPK